MGKAFESISPELRGWLEQQHLYFVATAPLAADGHLNCSPKGCDSFRVLSPTRVAYLDLTGSGIETISHLRENGRIVLMFCAFEGPPKIVRLHGTGEVIVPGQAGFDELAAAFPAIPGIRSVICVEVSRVSQSCGFGVPLYTYEGDRDTLPEWAARKGEAGLADYRREKNARSIDGLPGW